MNSSNMNSTSTNNNTPTTTSNLLTNLLKQTNSEQNSSVGNQQHATGGSSSDSTTSNSHSSHSPNENRRDLKNGTGSPRTPSPTDVSTALKRKSDDQDIMNGQDNGLEEHKQPRLDSQISS